MLFNLTVTRVCHIIMHVMYIDNAQLIDYAYKHRSYVGYSCNTSHACGSRM